MEEGFLLACLLPHMQLAFLNTQGPMPTNGAANSKPVPHTSVINQAVSRSRGPKVL